MSKNPLFRNDEENDKVIWNTHADPDHHQKLTTLFLAHACQVWSTSVSAFVSYPVFSQIGQCCINSEFKHCTNYATIHDLIKLPLAIVKAALCVGTVHLLVCSFVRLSVAKMGTKTRFS